MLAATRKPVSMSGIVCWNTKDPLFGKFKKEKLEPVAWSCSQKTKTEAEKFSGRTFEVDGKTPMDSSMLWITSEMHRREQSNIKVETSICWRRVLNNAGVT